MTDITEKMKIEMLKFYDKGLFIRRVHPAL